MKSAEYRSALASLESMRPTLERILKAAQTGAQEIETLEERQKTLEGNIRGLQERERRANEAAAAARTAADDATRTTDAARAENTRRIEQGKAQLEALQKKITQLHAEAGQASRTLTDLRHAIEDAERRGQQAKERADRIAAAAAEAAR